MKNPGKKLAVGCAVTGGICLIGVFGILVAIGIAIETGRLPDTAPIPAGKIHPRQIKQLEQMGVIEPDENVLYFYSAASFSIRGDGNLFTERRVVSYQQNDDQLDLYEATYEQIASIDFEPSGSWIDDSTITVTSNDGSWFVLYVSTESNGDKTFYQKLTETWKRNAN